MKKLLSWMLMCCFLIPCTALADVASQVGAPAHTTETFSSNTGKVVITLDADVTVPDTNNVRVYQAMPRLFTTVEADAMAQAVFANRAYTYAGTGNYSESAPVRVYESVVTVLDIGKEWPEYTLDVYQSTKNNGAADWVEAKLERWQVYGEPIYWLVFPEDMRLNTTPNGCSVTYEDARRMADEAVRAFAPQFTCMAQGVLDGELAGIETKDGKLSYTNEQQAWILWYTRGDLAMPVTAEGTNPSGDYNRQHGLEEIIITITDDGICGLNYLFPHDVSVLQENCALLPFEQIMDVVRRVMPLSMGWLESSYNDIRVQITDIRLGYARVMSKDKPDCYEYVPVWDFFGTREARKVKNGEIASRHDSPFISYFTVNAIDGTVIDRNYGY
ncbi:MAG: hypothetical protein IKM26_04020 [Clostridia bacterium]|nr:hypothetical protein [Clostridia bacterium]